MAGQRSLRTTTARASTPTSPPTQAASPEARRADRHPSSLECFCWGRGGGWLGGHPERGGGEGGGESLPAPVAPGPGGESRLPAALAKSQCCLHPPPPTLGTPSPGGRAGERRPALCPTVASRNTYCSAHLPLGPGSGSCPDTPARADPHPVRPQLQDPARPMWAHGVLDPGEAEETEREEEEGIQPAPRPQWVLAGGCRLKTPGEHVTHPGPQAGGEGELASQWGRRVHWYLEMAGCGWGGLGGGEGRGRSRGGDHRKPKLSHRRALGTCGGQCSRSRRMG